jgi:hypothetical protein
MRRILSILPLAGAIAPLIPTDASACGGFFCSQTPVVQSAERIVFEVEGDLVTAYVQLQFLGNDPRFAWIVPVPSVPEVTVGVGQAMFDALESQTSPLFGEQPLNEAAAFTSIGASCGGAVDPGPPRLTARVVPQPEVKVWKKEKVGPYEFAVVSGSSADDLDEWLRINGYRSDPSSRPIVQEYLDAEMKLLALKVSNDAGTSALEPIRLQYHDPEGCARIPLKLTAIAATPGLEIIAWVFGSARAVPTNFGEVTIDPLQLGASSDYMPAVARQIDAEAAGRGWVTEFAQPTSRLVSGSDSVLNDLVSSHTYVTRLHTVIDPSEMTVDPELRLDPSREDVRREITLGQDRGASISAGGLLGILAIAMRLRRRRS